MRPAVSLRASSALTLLLLMLLLLMRLLMLQLHQLLVWLHEKSGRKAKVKHNHVRPTGRPATTKSHRVLCQ